MRIRANSALNMREQYDNGDISLEEFRDQMNVIGSPLGNSETRNGAPVVETRDREDERPGENTPYGMPAPGEKERSDAIKARYERSNGVTVPGVSEIKGEPNERLVRGQSMAEYVRRAAENGVQTASEGSAPRRMENRDQEYLNEYWGHRLGFARRESRALAEDTSGSGLAITPQSWTAQVVDFLYADAVLGQLGISRVPLPTEIQNVPVHTAPVQPAWLAENATIGLDANPAFSTLQLNAKGGFKDITTFSIELAQDAYVQGGLPGFLGRIVCPEHGACR